ncbi:RtcB family protein [Saxibacter everestensis]|uniref:RtcB family protein n=1 Tax=Saxibacter everestensis TaxID=2909229 RepID=UPI0032E35F73
MANNRIDLPDPDLAYLIADTSEFEQYIRGLRWTQEFARFNREETMDRTLAALSAYMDAEADRSVK